MKQTNTNKIIVVVMITSTIINITGYYLINNRFDQEVDCNLFALDFDNYIERIGYEVYLDGNSTSFVEINRNGTILVQNIERFVENEVGDHMIKHPKHFSDLLFIEPLIIQLRERPETSCKFIDSGDKIQIDYYEEHDASFQYVIDLSYNAMDRYTITDTFDLIDDFESLAFKMRHVWYNWLPNLNFTISVIAAEKDYP